MKITAFLPLALAFTATAEMNLYSLPTPAKRDASALESAVTQISDAITKLDGAVKAFNGDASQVKSDAENLITTVKNSVSSIASSGSIQVTDFTGIQNYVNTLQASGKSLLADLQSKVGAFEAAGLCGSVQSTVGDVSTEFESFIGGIVKQLPESLQGSVSLLTGSVTDALKNGAASFEGSQCKDNSGGSYPTSAIATSSSVAAGSYPTSAISSSAVAATSSAGAGGSVVTVTVTAPCACGTTATSTGISIPFITSTSSLAYPTGSNSTIPGTATSSIPVPTGGAASNGVGAVGLMAGLAAALFV
ncbi:hydrophobic surface binding protein A-domain-containing protein [Xylaria intraflava]|nr:hydrophobic surface binding protein A-domain-containing protein [Xylaria intraflava]